MMDIEELRGRMREMESSFTYEMKTMRFMMSEKDRHVRILNDLIDSNFREIRSALNELKLGVDQIVAAIQQISVAVSELVDSIQKQRSSVKLLHEHYGNVDGNSRISKEEQLNLSREILQLQKNSTAIMELISNIDDIAERLGILSINGAIQAARSGEMGKGFAVVTTEMRKLSDNVIETTESQKKAAEGILSLIDQSGVSQKIVLDRTEDVLSALSVFSGNIDNINSQIDRVAENSEELSATVHEFSATIEQISRNVDSIHSMMDAFYFQYSHETHLGNLVAEAAGKLRELSAAEDSFEASAMKHMAYFHNHFTDLEGNKILAMSRVFIALPFDQLPRAYQAAAEATPGYETARYLCLIGTAGSDPQWNSIGNSKTHKMIRLPEDKKNLTGMPMLDKVFSSLGVPYDRIIRPPENGAAEQVEGYYCEDDAAGSPFIPDKTFLKEYGISSQLSIGGILPSGAVFTCFLFLKRRISELEAESLRILAPVLQLCFKGFDEQKKYWAI